MQASSSVKEMTGRGVINFLFFKSIPYYIRVYVCLGLIACGLILQIAFLKLFPGLIFLILVIPFIFVKGYNNKISFKNLDLNENWEPTKMEKVDEIIHLDRKIKKWDSDWIDISCVKGFLLIALLSVGMYFLSRYVNSTIGFNVGSILFYDYLILFIPFWLSGIREFFAQPLLIKKISVIKMLHAYFESIRNENEELRILVKLNQAQNKKAFPSDIKLMITFKNKPENFIGIQGQVCINNVQNVFYPYFYCVILAKKGFGLDKWGNMLNFSKFFTEYKKEKEVELIVIRQHTTKTSGYHTKEVTQQEILLKTLLNTRKILRNI